LKNSPARKEFIARPLAIIDQGCIECDYLSICHGGCPVRTFTKKQTLMEKDPYCGLYKALFHHAERAAVKLAKRKMFVRRVEDPRFESARRSILQET
jgi:sulfatase maturation enzyme AslB (radical SAM superfamily)